MVIWTNKMIVHRNPLGGSPKLCEEHHILAHMNTLHTTKYIETKQMCEMQTNYLNNFLFHIKVVTSFLWKCWKFLSLSVTSKCLLASYLAFLRNFRSLHSFFNSPLNYPQPYLNTCSYFKSYPHLLPRNEPPLLSLPLSLLLRSLFASRSPPSRPVVLGRTPEIFLSPCCRRVISTASDWTLSELMVQIDLDLIQIDEVLILPLAPLYRTELLLIDMCFYFIFYQNMTIIVLLCSPDFKIRVLIRVNTSDHCS